MPNRDPITRLRCPFKRRYKWQSIHFELTGAIRVSPNGIDDGLRRPRSLCRIIEREEDFEPDLSRRGVRFWYLSRSCLVGRTDVEHKCVNSGGLREVHIIRPVTLAVGVGIADLEID